MKQLLKLFEHLFTIRVLEYSPADNEIWHEDVSVYTVYNIDDTFLGWIYVDPYPRAGKYGHFANFAIHPVRAWED